MNEEYKYITVYRSGGDSDSKSMDSLPQNTLQGLELDPVKLKKTSNHSAVLRIRHKHQ